MKNIFIVVYGGGHAAMLLPILKEILKKGSCRLTVLALTTAGSLFEAEKIEYVSYKNFTRLVDVSFTDIGESLVGPYSASSVIPYDESVAYHGINFLDLVIQHGENHAHAVYENAGRQGFYPINFMKRLLTELKIDLLIATNSPRSERAAIDAAGELGIKSLCLVDLFALQEVKWIGNKHYASKLCVLNQSVKDMFIEAGRQNHEIEVTGNPAFDSLVDPKIIAQGQVIRADRGWTEDKLITLLYASQPEPEKHPFNELSGNPELPRDIERSLRKFIENNSSYRLVVRYHPSENVIFQPQERVVFSPRTENLHALLHAVNIVIVTASTVGLEGHLIGKPIISIDNSIFTDDAPYSRMGISSGIQNLSMLPNEIIYQAENLAAQGQDVIELDATSKVMAVIDELLIGA
jgi:hypothetical protein